MEELEIEGNHTILECVVGSYMYGLATEKSDIDTRSIFVRPNSYFLGIERKKSTFCLTNPDHTIYELGHFLEIALKGNSTTLECLYANKYKILLPAGRELIEKRELFLSKKIKQSYLGNVYQIIRNFDKFPIEKHQKKIIQCLRLLNHLEQLLENGELQPELSLAERQRIFHYSKLDMVNAIIMISEEIERLRLKQCHFPDEPNSEKINQLCIYLRRKYSES